MRTTDLATIRTSPSSFTWGYVLCFHEVGRYCVVEFKERDRQLAGYVPRISFHVYVDGKDTHTGYDTLDRALVGAIAHGNLEVNEARWMAFAASKLLQKAGT